MNGETVEISTQDGVADAYLARPAEQGTSRPGVLFLMDAFGLRPRIEEMVDRIAALGAFHAGGLVSDDEDSPHLSAGAISAELYLGHADNDQSMTPEHIAALEQALDQAGVRYRSELYEGAAHGYTMSDTAAYDETAAERHFTELFALLDRTIAD
jgi:dienelactone hydrolase